MTRKTPFRFNTSRFASICITAFTLFSFCHCNKVIESGVRSSTVISGDATAIDKLPRNTLKTHMINGSLYVIDAGWSVDAGQTYLVGVSTLYDLNRKNLGTAQRKILIDSIVIAESNAPMLNNDQKRLTLLTTLSIIDATALAICVAVPKACYGSCPTFYYGDNNDLMHVNGEGFSAAVLPCLEESDVDDLQNPSFHGHSVSLTMKNEAYETHAVNMVKLLAVERKSNEIILQDPQNHFFACDKIIPLESAVSAGGEVTGLLLEKDDREQFSLTYPDQLKTTESLDLTFTNDARDADLGFVLNFRQTLATTFVFYSVLGFMGNNTGDYYAAVERSRFLTSQVKKRCQALSQIEVLAYNERNRKWVTCNTIIETGPIAKNQQMVKIPFDCSRQGKVKIKLQCYQGFFRFDYAALVRIAHEVTPIELTADKVMHGNTIDEEAEKSLAFDDEDRLASMPGDVWKLNFSIPDTKEDNDYAFFVLSKGYYLEWIRSNWLTEENAEMLRGIILRDPETWEYLSRAYKEVEAEMESNFWSSSVTM